MRTKIYLIITTFMLSQSSHAEEQYQAPPAQVSVVKTENKLLAPTTLISGSVISMNDSKIASQVSGELLWLAQVGQKVSQGQTIAEIDPTRYQLAVKTADSRIKGLQADLEFRNQEVIRLKELATRNNTSKARLQEETAKQMMLIQDIRAAKAALAAAEYDLSLTKVSAPFDAIVTDRFSSKGEYLMLGSQLLRLVDIDNTEITFNVPIELLSFMTVGEQLQVESKQLSERVAIRSIVPVGDAVSRMVTVRLKPTTPSWIIGSPVSVSVPSAKAKARVAFPRDALIIKGSDVYIFRIGEDMTAERIDASIVALDGESVAIQAALREGDQIVIRGGERLMPGQKVALLSSAE